MKEQISKTLKRLGLMSAMDLKKKVLGIDDICDSSKRLDFELTLQRMISAGEVQLDKDWKVFI